MYKNGPNRKPSNKACNTVTKTTLDIIIVDIAKTLWQTLQKKMSLKVNTLQKKLPKMRVRKKRSKNKQSPNDGMTV